MAAVAPTSPYVYMAVFFFCLSACSSDLIFIRASLVGGFVGLVLAALSGYSPSGSFEFIPLAEGIIDIPMFVNMGLCALNFYVCIRLIRDELWTNIQDDDELALLFFFQARCGATDVEFQSIFKNGYFLDLPRDTEVSECRFRLYLVVEGKVECHCKFHGEPTEPFIKRSGEFFDIRLFNLFTFPIGFDNTDFRAFTMMDTKLFCWELEGLQAMRKVPMLINYWDFTVLRSLAASGVRHHLKATDTLYDALLIPEEHDWLDGARSRDFMPRSQKPTILRELERVARSFHVIPPHGVRHSPRILEPNPMNVRMEQTFKDSILLSTTQENEEKTTPQIDECDNHLAANKSDGDDTSRASSHKEGTSSDSLFEA